MTVLQSLINKKDSFEIIRDQIAAILVNEIANQKALAALAVPAVNVADWDLRVFIERSNPWSEWVSSTQDVEIDDREIVNVWYSVSDFDMSRSNVVSDQTARMDFNIDIYGFASSANDVAGGHVPGDYQSALDVHRAVRLVRNILMASSNTYLQLRGLVNGRWINSITMFQPTLENRAVENVNAARIAFSVTAREFSPQYEGQDFEELLIDVLRQETGEILASAHYDYAT